MYNLVHILIVLMNVFFLLILCNYRIKPLSLVEIALIIVREMSSKLSW